MKVILRVVSQKGFCHLNHKPGDEIIVSENGVEGKICLHALYSMIPKAFAILYGAKFPWLKDGLNKSYQAARKTNNKRSQCWIKFYRYGKIIYLQI